MKESKKILRNWKIFWTILAIILSIFVICIGVKYNFCFDDKIGWNIINIECSENIIGKITECAISTEPSASSIFFHSVTGLFGFLLIQSLHIPIWLYRKELIR